MSKIPVLTNISQRLYDIRNQLRLEPVPNSNREVGRATTLALTKIGEAIFWLDQATLAQIAQETNDSIAEK